jgi:hypothetical protein
MIIMIISFTKRLLTNITTITFVPFLLTTSWHCRVLVFPVCVIIIRWRLLCHHQVKTLLSSQVGNVELIDAFNVISRVLSMVLFLRASCCFPAEKKTHSIPPPDAGQPWNCLHILTTSRVRLVDMSVTWQTTRPIVKDVYLTELVIRDAMM